MLKSVKKICLLLLVSSGYSLLPPLAQSKREIRSLIEDPRFYDSLGSAEAIQQIVRNDRGYLVTTQHYTMQVDLRTISRDKPICGPAQFEFDFHIPSPKN